MTALWLDPSPQVPLGHPDLRLVPGGARDVGGEELAPVAHGRRPHRVPVEVRRRRTLLAVMGLLLIALALPLGGAGGHSHPTGSTPAEAGHPSSYVVQPGDTLWSIAERMAPAADPRPLVAELSAQTGSDHVVPGERLVLP
ncbi:MAG: LysM peptidoglycan-binding domain-containing protein [Acidimicrobiales bacterium]